MIFFEVPIRTRSATPVAGSRWAIYWAVGREGVHLTKKAWKKIAATCKKKMAPAEIRFYLMRLRFTYSPVSMIYFIQLANVFE